MHRATVHTLDGNAERMCETDGGGPAEHQETWVTHLASVPDRTANAFFHAHQHGISPSIKHRGRSERRKRANNVEYVDKANIHDSRTDRGAPGATGRATGDTICCKV